MNIMDHAKAGQMPPAANAAAMPAGTGVLPRIAAALSVQDALLTRIRGVVTDLERLR